MVQTSVRTLPVQTRTVRKVKQRAVPIKPEVAPPCPAVAPRGIVKERDESLFGAQCLTPL